MTDTVQASEVVAVVQPEKGPAIEVKAPVVATPPGASKQPPAPINKAPEVKAPDPVVVDPKVKEAADKAAAEAATLAEAARIQKDAEDAKAKEREGWQKEYIKVENEHAQAAINLMNEAGVSPIEANAIFAKSIETKNLSDIDWPTLEAKIGKDKTALVKAGVTQFFNEHVSVQEAATQAAFEIVGGKENWDKVKNWAQVREKADPVYAKKVAEYRKAIDVGGFSAKAAVTALKADYEGDPKNGGLGQGTLTVGGNKPTIYGEPLSRMDYAKEKMAAHKRGAKLPELQAIDARRRAGMAQGI